MFAIPALPSVAIAAVICGSRRGTGRLGCVALARHPTQRGAFGTSKAPRRFAQLRR